MAMPDRTAVELPEDLRLTLLWHFGTTDPELIHELMVITPASTPFDEMLRCSREQLKKLTGAGMAGPEADSPSIDRIRIASGND